MSPREQDRRRGVRLGAVGWTGLALAACVFALGWFVCVNRLGWWVGGLLGWWPSAIVAAAVSLGPITLVRRIRSAAARPEPAPAAPPLTAPARTQRPKTQQSKRIVSDLHAD